MAFITNEKNFLCKKHFVFCQNNIILESSDNNFILPSHLCIQKFLSNMLASDWFAEPELDYSAYMLENSAPLPSNCESIPLRQYFTLAGEQGGCMAARARSLLIWRKNNRFCSRCGNPLQEHTLHTSRFCKICKKEFFPSIEPAIIVLVSHKDKLLLVKHKKHTMNKYACISGFIESGETLEECVHREVKEETNITIKNLRYCISQAWPFPDMLMAGFRAEYAGGKIIPQAEEIIDVQWFSKDNLPLTPDKGSLAYRLISGEFG